MDIAQETARRFVNGLLEATGWTPTALARRAGLVPSTLTRFLNSTSATHTLSDRSLAAIRTAAAKELGIGRVDNLWLVAQHAGAVASAITSSLRN